MTPGIRPNLVCRICGLSRRTLGADDPRMWTCAECGAVRIGPCLRPDLPLDLRSLRIAAPDGILRNKYRLVAALGEGAHGVTFLAEHLYLNHPCVVKILHRALDSGDAGERVLNEARIGYRVNHPNVVRVLDCDRHNDLWYFVTEYVDGVSLESVVNSGRRMPWRQVQRLALDALAGLAAIHRAGLIHHDIKPGNLILGADQELHVSDLGIARLQQESRSLGNAAPIATGTLAYAAPETMLAGATTDERVDLYGLGATLYQLLTGVLPFASRSVFASILRQQNSPARWPETADTDTPDWLRDCVLRLLAADPAERFPDAAEAARALQRDPNVGWIGFALIDYLGRQLSKIHGLYVVDPDRLQAVLPPADKRTLFSERYLAAGAKLGAGTIITGEYQVAGDSLHVMLRILRAEKPADSELIEIDGALSSLGTLQADLLDRLGAHLGLEAAPNRRPTAGADADVQELYVRAKQRFLAAEYAAAIETAERVVERVPDHAEAIGLLGVCYARVGDYGRAQCYHHRVLEIAEARHDPRLMVEAHANLGVMHYFGGAYEEAHAAYARAAAEATALRLHAEAAQIYNNLGFVLYRLGRSAEAEQAFRRSIATHTEFGAPLALIGPHNGLGNVLTDQGRYDEARIHYRRALALAQELRDRANIGTSHMHLGRLAAMEGRYGEAKLEFAQALNTLEETTFWNGLARLYEFMADMNLRLQQFAEADRCAQRRLELARQHANRRMEAAAWRQKAAALTGMERGAEAAHALAVAERIDAEGAEARA
jgi:tetratricopeptide (TPR) repeat protein/tRNA A-37 threonylcarbamoyl transferase component Bud32